MRKRKYRLHYGDYAPEENERLYMDMSKKGWRLAKRGIFFSRFPSSSNTSSSRAGVR